MPEQGVFRGASALRVVCAWCGTLLRASWDANALTSHGVCPACVEQLLPVDGGSRVVARTKVRGTAARREC